MPDEPADLLLPALPTTRRLGGSELEVGPIAYGCWRFARSSVADASAKIGAALDAGLTLIDTADIYGYLGDPNATPSGFGDAEALLGEVLAANPSWRERMVVATKGGIRPPVPYDQSPAYLRAACEASLRRLGVDVIDLYQVHRPDHLTSAAEMAEGLDALVAAGLVRHIGVSNFTVAQHRALAAHLAAPIVTTQPEWHPLRQEPLTDGTLDLCGELGVTPLVWSPLAGGRLAGDVDPADERAVAVAGVADRLAGEQGVDRAAVLLAWVAHHPSGAIPIVGSQRPERITAAADALRVRLTRNEWYEILVAGRGVRMP
ncbi:MAG: aldo/keto reductase [Acidimicrobiales bacterium]